MQEEIMQRRKLAMTLVEILVVIAIVCTLIALLLPSIRSAREPARRNSCMNNLKQIGLALLAYEEDHGTLPPAYTADTEGNRLHSWRTLILPYMEQQQLYESIDLSKPWDNPANAKAREAVVESYECPSSPEPHGLTNYLAVIGPDCSFSGSVPRTISEIADGPTNTIMVIDVNREQVVHWMSPHDISMDEVLEYGLGSSMNHPEIILALFADGHTQAIDLDVDQGILRAMLTIAGGETIFDNW